MREVRVDLLRELAGLGTWSVQRGLSFLRKIHSPLIRDPYSVEMETLLEQAETRIGSENPSAVLLLKLRAMADILLAADLLWLNGPYARHRMGSVTGLSPERAITFSWSFVPCILADGSDACVRYLLCGLARDSRGECLIPQWSRHLMDLLFMQSIKTAHEMLLARDPGDAPVSFCVLPLSEPMDSPLFCGDSAGLPVYLCGRQLSQGRLWPRSVLATGRLADGRIAEVGFVREKMEEARKAGARIFLYPASNLRPEREARDSMVCVPVEEVIWAENACDLGRLDSLEVNRLLDTLSSAEKFAAFCADIPDVAMGLVDQAVDRLVTPIVTDSGLFERFVRSMETLMVSGRLSPAGFLASRFGPGIETAEKLDPVHVLMWCVFNLELANHRGDVATARVWADRARTVKGEALKHPGGRGLSPWLENHGFVATCHNRYDFRPEMIGGLAVIAEKAEQFFLYSTEGVDGAIEPSLGAIYGTMAQHYGFCGPAYLEETLRFSKKAMERFGGTYGQPDFSAEKVNILRQYNHITYAFLDAGKDEEAQRHLLLYLEKPDLDQVVQDLDTLSQWELALVARFMAEAGDGALAEACVDFAGKARAERVVEKHPWQLWCLNMARLAQKTGDTTLARELARQSLGICLSNDAGATMNAMALLPLAFLHAENLSTLADLEPCYRKAAETALGLNPDHFSAFYLLDCQAGLSEITRRPGSFFPFSYR